MQISIHLLRIACDFDVRLLTLTLTPPPIPILIQKLFGKLYFYTKLSKNPINFVDFAIHNFNLIEETNNHPQNTVMIFLHRFQLTYFIRFRYQISLSLICNHFITRFDIFLTKKFYSID